MIMHPKRKKGNLKHGPLGRQEMIADPRSSKEKERPSLMSLPMSTIRTSARTEVGGKLDIQAPQPMRTPIHNRDRKKYCSFHKDVGHLTDDCQN